jgi:hypothetical protein
MLAGSMMAGAVALGYVATSATLRADTPDYLPSISDLMIATIQPRHIRLWIAAHAGNWEFSAYELGNMRGAFNRIGRAHPTVDNNSFPDMAVAVTQQPFADLTTAIKAKDPIAFDKAYSDLTAACNSCHQATNHAAVVIRVPQAGLSADQDFTPSTSQ